MTELRKEKSSFFPPSLRMDPFDINSVWGACSKVDLGDVFVFFLSNVKNKKCRFKAKKFIFEFVNL